MQGRVQATNLFVRDAPSYSGKKLSTLKRDDLVDIAGQVFGGEQGDYNRQWYRLTNQTYVYSGYVQSVKTNLNPVVTDIPDSGVLGEITIPYADSYLRHQYQPILWPTFVLCDHPLGHGHGGG